MNIVIVGTGMYVSGRGTQGFGTVLPAVFEWKKKGGNFKSLYLVGTGHQGLNLAKQKISRLSRRMGVKLDIKYFPVGVRRDPDSFKQAINEIPKPASIIVAVPDNLHRRVVGYAIENGLHSLVVKPLVPTVREARGLISLHKNNKVYCAVEFHKRFDYANLKLKDAVSRGLIGRPLYFLVEYSQKKSIPSKRFIKWVTKTNVFQYLGVHYVDIIYFATRAKPKRAMAIGQKGWLASRRINTYDSVSAVVEWEGPSGATFSSHILTNWIDPESSSSVSDQKIKVIGTKGRFESDQKKRGISMISDDHGIEEPNPYFCSDYGAKGEVSYRGYGIESIHQFLEDVVRIEKGEIRINDLDKIRPTFKEALISTAVLEAVNKSLKQKGEWVDIEGI